MDDWVNFSILLLWFVSSLDILIYYGKPWRLLLKQLICWIFTLYSLYAPLQCELFQGCGAVVKISQLRLPSSSLHEHGSSFGALGFHEGGSCSGALFFHDIGSSDFYSFSHINILIVLVCFKLNGKLMTSSTQNQENIPRILSNLI